jgi:hypothetical protein
LSPASTAVCFVCVLQEDAIIGLPSQMLLLPLKRLPSLWMDFRVAIGNDTFATLLSVSRFLRGSQQPP